MHCIHVSLGPFTKHSWRQDIICASHSRWHHTWLTGLSVFSISVHEQNTASAAMRTHSGFANTLCCSRCPSSLIGASSMHHKQPGISWSNLTTWQPEEWNPNPVHVSQLRIARHRLSQHLNPDPHTQPRHIPRLHTLPIALKIGIRRLQRNHTPRIQNTPQILLRHRLR